MSCNLNIFVSFPIPCPEDWIFKKSVHLCQMLGVDFFDIDWTGDEKTSKHAIKIIKPLTADDIEEIREVYPEIKNAERYIGKIGVVTGYGPEPLIIEGAQVLFIPTRIAPYFKEFPKGPWPLISALLNWCNVTFAKWQGRVFLGVEGDPSVIEVTESWLAEMNTFYFEHGHLPLLEFEKQHLVRGKFGPILDCPWCKIPLQYLGSIDRCCGCGREWKHPKSMEKDDGSETKRSIG